MVDKYEYCPDGESDMRVIEPNASGSFVYVRADAFDAIWDAFTHIADSEFGMTGEELYEMLRHSQYIGGERVIDLVDLGFQSDAEVKE